MNVFVIALVASTLVFAAAAVLFSLREGRTRKSLEEEKKEVTRKWHELEAVTNLAEVIDYSLDIEKIIKAMIATIEKLFSYTAVAFIQTEESTLRFTIISQVELGKTFIESVKKYCLDAVYQLDSNKRAYAVIENIQSKITPKDELRLGSYFIVPLVINKKFEGLILVGDSLKNQYKSEDMTILYNVAKHSMKTVERLQSIIETEKGRLNSLLLSISTGAIMLSVKDNIMELSAINTAAKEFLSLEGSPDTYKVLTSFTPNARLQENIKKVLEEKTTSVIEEVKINDQIFKIFINPVFFFGTGKIIGVSITMQNITLEKQIQEIRETFTHMVVHELRAPLTSMKGASELLLSGKLAKDEQSKMTQLIKDSTIRMLGDISDLLDASKIEAGRFEIFKQPSNINDLISERVKVFIHMATQKTITLTLSLDETIPEFDFDYERIGQVLNNLLSNSIKYTHQGGKIQVKSAVDGKFCKVEVTDNGIGIVKEKQSRLFAKYAQVGQGGFKTGTTGLGLYISKSIVESHDGKIGLESEDGRGTKVYFLIPIVHNKQEAMPKPTGIPQPRVVN